MPYKVYLEPDGKGNDTWVLLNKDIAFHPRNLKNPKAGLFPAKFYSLQWARRIKNLLNAKKRPDGLKQAIREIKREIAIIDNSIEQAYTGDYTDEEKQEGLKLALKIINKHCKGR